MSNNQTPLVSIITVVYNGAAIIEQTLQKAVAQTYRNFELVIIDGGSKDDTVAIAKKFSAHIGTLISEPDKGIFDAMNKGIRHAKGEWLYFLNAGDEFLSEHTIQNVFSRAVPEDAEFIYGKFQSKNDPSGVNYISGGRTTLKDFYFRYPICHQATFTHRRAFERIGTYDLSFSIIADVEWEAHFFKSWPQKTFYVDETIAYYEIVGHSYNKRMPGYREFLRIGRRHFPLHIALFNYLLYPVIWLKVKIIRNFQETAPFKLYRRLRFRNRLAGSV